MPVPYGEMLVGSRRISQTSAPVMKAGRKGRGYRAAGVKEKNPAVIADRNCGRVTKIKCKELFLYHDKN
ncbi:hypothetical protein BANRA_00009 [Escherichia coli]|nr:hypothetical protein BANRA_00009 [Escherichia coli]